MRIRLRFAKLGKVRFTSHRDVVRIWERALRRARLPVVYTAGFSPRPKLSFGLALSTGYESLAEYVDVEVAEAGADAGPLDVERLPGRLSSELPVGIDVVAAGTVEPGEASLQEAVRSCTWRIEALGVEADAAEALIDAARSAETLIVTRQRKGRDVTDDLRPAVLSVSLVGATAAGTEIEAELAVHPRSVRPGELLVALGRGLEEGRVCRTAQWIWRHGERGEPLPAAVDLPISAPHADACVTRRDHSDGRTRTRTSPFQLHRRPTIGDRGPARSLHPLPEWSLGRGG